MGGRVLTKQKDIFEGAAEHFDKLFSPEKQEMNVVDFLGEAHEDIPKLSADDKSFTDNIITHEEVSQYVRKKLKNGKSPGSSGFSAEFYKVFWPQLGRHVTKAISHSLDSGILPTIQRQGLITLIPKPGRDHSSIKGYRPITLLNTLYKICSGVLAERLKSHLPKLICSDQSGFIEGRYIGDVIRNTLDIISDAQEKKINALVLTADLEQAFDKLTFSCILQALELFNFGPRFRGWIKVLLTENYSNVLMCGFLSHKINVKRSARQGDPIAPYLFVIALEVLALRIRHDSRIKGYSCGSREQKLSLLADDVTCYFEGTKQEIESSLRILYDILQEFEHVSGAGGQPKLQFGHCNYQHQKVA